MASVERKQLAFDTCLEGGFHIDGRKDGEKPRKSLDAYVQDRIILDMQGNAIYRGVTEANQPARSLSAALATPDLANTHFRQFRLFHPASFRSLSRVEPILPPTTPTPLPPLPHCPSSATPVEQIAFINLCTSSPAVPPPHQLAYPASYPFRYPSPNRVAHTCPLCSSEDIGGVIASEGGTMFCEGATRRSCRSLWRFGACAGYGALKWLEWDLA
ncbi:hypothetical protein JB92DRAFT_2832487 [Gautieria morchelliformis]|nr:hypothetical protein JB92DRAFT_2832487 [Gautieria morchelliformis]